MTKTQTTMETMAAGGYTPIHNNKTAQTEYCGKCKKNTAIVFRNNETQATITRCPLCGHDKITCD